MLLGAVDPQELGEANGYLGHEGSEETEWPEGDDWVEGDQGG